jgi:hypothetical protein
MSNSATAGINILAISQHSFPISYDRADNRPQARLAALKIKELQQAVD